MAKEKDDNQRLLDALNSVNEIDPYAKFLDECSLSSADDWIDTGSMVLNALISGSIYRGIPKGRITQFVGASQTFKTGFALQIIANAQKKGMAVLLFDTENALESESCETFGVDIKRVKKSDTTSIEKVRNTIYTFLTNVREKGLEGKFIIVIDSLANLQSELEIKRMDNDKTSADMGTNAKAIKSLLKTCTNMAAATNTPIVITNHIYDDPNAMYPSLEKNISGGKAAVYLPSVTVQLARKLVKDEEVKLADTKLAASQKNYSGVIIRALTVKNRFIKQYLEGEMYLSFSSGLHKYYGLLEIMKGMGVVSNSGATYTDFEGNKLGYAKSFRNDTELWEGKLLPELENRIKKEWAYGNLNEAEDFPDEEDNESDDSGDSSDKTGEEPTQSSPLDKLKDLKKKVSAKLDEHEQEDEVPDEE